MAELEDVYLCPVRMEERPVCLNVLPCDEHGVKDKDDSINKFGKFLMRNGTQPRGSTVPAGDEFDITIIVQPSEDPNHHACNLPHSDHGYGSTGFDEGTIIRCNGCGRHYFCAPYFGSYGPVTVWRRVRPWHWRKRRQIAVQGRSWGTSDSDSPEPGTVRTERRW